MKDLIEQYLPELIIIIIVTIALVAFMIWRNQKDKRPFDRDVDEVFDK